MTLSFQIKLSNTCIQTIWPVIFKGVAAILKTKGRYIFATPRFERRSGRTSHGSLDVNDRPECISKNTITGNFQTRWDRPALERFVSNPASLQDQLFYGATLQTQNKAENTWLLALLEILIAQTQSQVLRRKLARVARLILFAPEIFFVAEKE
jgi:hypothetical protein